MKKSDWRLTSDVIGLIISEESENYEVSNFKCVGTIFITLPDKKQHLSFLNRKIKSNYVTSPFKIELENERIEVRLGEDSNLYVKSDSFLNKENYYLLGNWVGSIIIEDEYTSIDKSKEICNLLTQLKCDNGKFDDIFEFIFSDDVIGAVNVVSSNMKEYRPSLNEMRRILNCEVLKKTRKWVPGHRYDSEKGTIYYLGEFLSRKSSKLTNTEYLSDKDMVPVHLYVEDLLDTEKTVTDVLKNRLFISDSNLGESILENFDDNNFIKAVYSISSMVDSGEVLVNDLTDEFDIRDCWPNMIKGILDKSTLKTNSGEIYYDNSIVFSFDPFTLYSKDKLDPKYNEEAINLINEIVNNIIRLSIYNYYNVNLYRSDLNFGSVFKDRSLEENIESIKKIIFNYSIVDYNSNRYNFFIDLFNNLELDIDKIISTNYSEFKDIIYPKLNSDKDYYFKYYELIGELSRNNFYSYLRDQSAKYSYKKVTLTDLFNFGELRDLIIKLSVYAMNNYGYGVSKFSVHEIGTVSKPMSFVEIEITLQDIINYYKGVSNIPQTLIDEIINKKFNKISIEADNNIDSIN